MGIDTIGNIFDAVLSKSFLNSRTVNLANVKAYYFIHGIVLDIDSS
jgi:hypothetical protein